MAIAFQIQSKHIYYFVVKKRAKSQPRVGTKVNSALGHIIVTHVHYSIGDFRHIPYFHAQSTNKALIAGAVAILIKMLESLTVRNNFTFETIISRLFEQKEMC